MRRPLWLLPLVTLVGCKATPDRQPPPGREPPPPAATSATANACASPAKVNDPANVAALPTTAGPFCLDPAGSDRGYGENAKAPLEPGICELYDGECAVYLKLGVKRVVEARYIDGGGTSATIDVKLSHFGSPEQALAMFTKRVLSAGDPAHPDTPKAIPGGTLATLGLGNAYVWRGAELVELTVNDAELSIEQLRQRGDALLPPLAKAIGEKLPGEMQLPAAAKRLPEEARLPLGIQYAMPDVFGEGTGPGAFGFYRDGTKRWRVLAIEATDDAQARRTLDAIGAGGAHEKGLGDGAVRAVIGETKAEWLVARKGKTLLGIGDEAFALRDGMSADDHANVCLALEDKRARLKAYLEKP